MTLFQRKYGNALPPNLDVLLNERFLRKQFKDPITSDDFQLIGPGSPELALAANGCAGAGRARRERSVVAARQSSQQQQQQQSADIRARRAVEPVTAGQAPGGILGVVSKSKETSLRIYNNHDKYNEWVFIATQMSVAGWRSDRRAGAGGRGGQPPVRRAATDAAQPGDGRGGFGQPLPRGGPGPGRNPGGFGGPGTGQQGRPSGGRF